MKKLKKLCDEILEGACAEALLIQADAMDFNPSIELKELEAIKAHLYSSAREYACNLVYELTADVFREESSNIKKRILEMAKSKLPADAAISYRAHPSVAGELELENVEQDNLLHPDKLQIRVSGREFEISLLPSAKDFLAGVRVTPEVLS